MLCNLQLMLAKYNEIFLDNSGEAVQIDVFKSIYDGIRLEDVRQVFLRNLHLPLNIEDGSRNNHGDGYEYELDLF